MEKEKETTEDDSVRAFRESLSRREHLNTTRFLNDTTKRKEVHEAMRVINKETMKMSLVERMGEAKEIVVAAINTVKELLGKEMGEKKGKNMKEDEEAIQER